MQFPVILASGRRRPLKVNFTELSVECRSGGTGSSLEKLSRQQAQTNGRKQMRLFWVRVKGVR